GPARWPSSTGTCRPEPRGPHPARSGGPLATIPGSQTPRGGTGMPNPTLNDDALRRIAREDQAGWAAPDARTAAPGGPLSDGPVSPYPPSPMTTGGVASAAAVLLGLMVVAGVYGWNAVETT